MEITEYKFGSITIDGRTYTGDIIIFPDSIKESWWREKGHSLCLKDINDVIQYRPDVFIMGCGYYSILKVPKNLFDELEAVGIKLIAFNSKKAVDYYNSLDNKSKVVFGIHLTC